MAVALDRAEAILHSSAPQARINASRPAAVVVVAERVPVQSVTKTQCGKVVDVLARTAAVRLARGDVAFVARASVKHDGAVAGHHTLIPGTTKPITSFVDEDAIAVFLTGNEHATVGASFGVRHCSSTMHVSFLPIPFVHITVAPAIRPEPMLLAALKCSRVYAAVVVGQQTLTVR